MAEFLRLEKYKEHGLQLPAICSVIGATGDFRSLVFCYVCCYYVFFRFQGSGKTSFLLTLSRDWDYVSGGVKLGRLVICYGFAQAIYEEIISNFKKSCPDLVVDCFNNFPPELSEESFWHSEDDSVQHLLILDDVSQHLTTEAFRTLVRGKRYCPVFLFSN